MAETCGPNKGQCIYCDAWVTIDTVPDVDDEEQWDALADEHKDGCEWIITRAHRLPVETQSADQTG